MTAPSPAYQEWARRRPFWIFYIEYKDRPGRAIEWRGYEGAVELHKRESDRKVLYAVKVTPKGDLPQLAAE